jgi:DNA-binding LacI/PurR family transcriptional regulator
MSDRRITLREVATRAGVSISTVSRVLRGDRSRPVEVGTEERIRTAARDLGYRPNLAAQSLARGEGGSGNAARQIGVVLGTTSYKFSDPFFSRVVEGIHAEILANRRHLRFVYSMADLNDPSLFGEMVRPDVIEGLIAIALRAQALRQLSATGVTPIVVVEGPEPAPGVDFVSCDKDGGMRQMLEHLWHIGHRSFAFLGEPSEERATRLQSWLAVTGAPPALVLSTANRWGMEDGYMVVHEWLRSAPAPLPSVIVAACDALAVGAMRAAREAGLNVPADLAVVGFDDTMGAFTHPLLTTIQVQREQLGRIAVRRLIARQRHPDEPFVRLTQTTQLVLRESCGRSLEALPA